MNETRAEIDRGRVLAGSSLVWGAGALSGYMSATDDIQWGASIAAGVVLYIGTRLIRREIDK